MAEPEQQPSMWDKAKGYMTGGSAAAAGVGAYGKFTRSAINSTGAPLGIRMPTKPVHLLRSAPMPVKVAGAVGMAGLAGLKYMAKRGEDE